MNIVGRFASCVGIGLFLLAGCSSAPDTLEGPSTEETADAPVAGAVGETPQAAEFAAIEGSSSVLDASEGALTEGNADGSGADATGETQQILDCTSGYFHPNNGAHGGWIEAWRLCNEGGGNYRICTGGSAPVRYWNSICLNGTIHDYYPQGWSGWIQTWEG